MEIDKETMKKISDCLYTINHLAGDSRGCYENARGNDSACYSNVDEIFKLLGIKHGDFPRPEFPQESW